MLVLMAFALLAGAGTAITPCVLPVLPALLSASGTGGRRRPLGVVAGLTLTHTITIVGLATVVQGVGVADGLLRSLAVVALALFGAVLLVPALARRLEAPLAGLSRLGPRSAGQGFWSGLGVGAALGFVYAPCAGPILAAVITVGATGSSTAETGLVAAAYGLGSAAVLLLMAFGGRRLADRVRAAGRGPVLQRAVAVVMLLTAVVMAAELDVRFQTALASHFPAFVVNPTRALERSDRVERRLADLRGRPRFDSGRVASAPETRAPGTPAPPLRSLGRAPDFTGNQRWFNTAGGRALSLAELRGRVVLVDFWTYTCINCIRTFPALRALHERYARAGLTIVGVHTPEFAFERDAGNVASAIGRNDLRYAVAQDNDYATWNAYGNQFWPAKYLIDAQGNVRYTHFGEGDEAQTEAAVRALLGEAGAQRLGSETGARGEAPTAQEATPETYLGTARAERFLPEPPRPGTHAYPGAGGPLPQSHFALRGTWRADRESSTAVRTASLDARFLGAEVYLVLSSAGGRPRRVGVLLDGRPIRAAESGPDVRGGAVTVREQRLYRLVALGRSQERNLTLRFPPGVSGFAFTFG